MKEKHVKAILDLMIKNNKEIISIIEEHRK